MCLTVSSLRTRTLCAVMAVCIVVPWEGVRADEPSVVAKPSSGAPAESRSDLSEQDKRERRAQRQRWIKGKQQAWWAGVREQLFVGIDLTNRQERQIDSILDEHLAKREKYRELHDELAALGTLHDPKRAAEIRNEVKALDPQLLPSVSIDAMRSSLSEGQRPVFDMNRAKFLADSQKQKADRAKKRRKHSRIELE